MNCAAPFCISMHERQTLGEQCQKVTFGRFVAGRLRRLPADDQAKQRKGYRFGAVSIRRDHHSSYSLVAGRIAPLTYVVAGDCSAFSANPYKTLSAARECLA